MDLRAEHEAFERRQQEGQRERGEADEDTDEEEEGPAVAEGEEEAEEEEAPKKKKPAAPKAPKAKPRSRAAKVTRLKVVWGVFNNSNLEVATYDYPQRQQAEEHAARLTADKKNTHFVQPVKKPMEDKKEE
jgi:hypothetical protein